MNLKYQVFDTILDSIFVIDSNHTVLYVNEAGGNLLGIAPRTLVRKAVKFETLFMFSQPITTLDDLNLITEPTAYQELNYITQGEKAGTLQISVQPVDNPEKHWLIFIRDTTLENDLHKKFKSELLKKEEVLQELQTAHANLEKHSQNLEEAVKQRTTQLTALNQLNQAMLDSLHQGFLVFDKNGLCLDIWSQACLQTIETNPTGKNIWDVLKVPPEKLATFREWIQLVFEETFPLASLMEIAPTHFEHSQKKSIKLTYFPIRDAAKKIEQIIMVSTDISDLILAQVKAEHEQQQVQKILTLVKNKKSFFGLHEDMLSQFVFLHEEIRKEKPDYISMYRSLHNLKGTTANFHLWTVSSDCHNAENLINSIKTPDSKVTKTDIQNSLAQIQTSYEKFLTEHEYLLGDIRSQKGRKIELFYSVLNTLLENIDSGEVKSALSQELLTESIGELLHQYFDLVEDLSFKLDKLVHPLEIVGGQIKVLPERYSPLLKTLVHSIRNSLDHGIERPEARVAMGKDEYGKISIKVENFIRTDGTWLRVRVSDDGKGIDPDIILAKLKELGLHQHIKENPQELIQAVFLPEFSTKSEVSEISGRGVGLNSIIIEAQKLNGHAWVETELKVGSSLIIEVPLLME